MSRQFTALVAAAVMASHAFGAAVGASEEPSRPAADPAEPPVEEQDPAGKKTEPVKTREVQLDELTLKVPETWKQGEPSNKLRLAEFKIPPADGDEGTIELTIFSFGGGGSVQQNVDRWIDQFEPAGRKVKVTTGESPQGRYVFADITGTYLQPVGPPILRQTERLPGARMLSVILAVPDKGVYYLKLAGPGKTVSGNAEHLRRAFGGEAAKEKPLKLDDDPAEGEAP